MALVPWARRLCRDLKGATDQSMTNVLILSAGRRVSLVRSFQAVAHVREISVFAADMNPRMSSACQIADNQFRLPHVHDPAYPDALAALCEDQEVALVIPTLDTELAILAHLRASFLARGTTIVVSDGNLIGICRDKRKTASFFAQMGLNSPKVMDPSALSYPLIVKPYDGSLSAGVHVLRSADDLSDTMLTSQRNIFCQYLDPTDYAEYTCDAYFDHAGHIRCVVPRLRIEVRGGEVAKGKTERNNIVPFLRETLTVLRGARGCLTIQIMRHRQTGALYLIEINPRFGGGYPLTSQSGAFYHEWLIREYIDGKAISSFDDWQDGMLMLRYDGEVFLHE